MLQSQSSLLKYKPRAELRFLSCNTFNYGDLFILIYHDSQSIPIRHWKRRSKRTTQKKSWSLACQRKATSSPTVYPQWWRFFSMESWWRLCSPKTARANTPKQSKTQWLTTICQSQCPKRVPWPSQDTIRCNRVFCWEVLASCPNEVHSMFLAEKE